MTKTKLKYVLTLIVLIVAAIVFSCNLGVTQGQTPVSFSPSDKFSIPSLNGTINFAVNGSYLNAVVKDNTWIFTNLTLQGSTRVGNLSVSVQNCNITIFSYSNFFGVRQTLRLSYTVQGVGVQMFNFGIGQINLQFSSTDWSVTRPGGVFLAEGQNWNITRDGTVTVTGLTGNITVIYFGFLSQLGVSNLPFYEAHSVAIAVTAAVAVTIVVAVVVKVEVKRRQEKELSQNA